MFGVSGSADVPTVRPFYTRVCKNTQETLSDQTHFIRTVQL
jgi:hypothetical protein